MLRVYYHSEDQINKAEGIGCFEKIVPEKIFWVDLQFATELELKKVESVFNLDFNQLKSENELESNSRFYESEDVVFISANFITVKENFFETTPVYLYLLSEVLISERTADLTSFAETVKKMKRNKKAFQNGSDILEGILETKVDLDADFIEHIAKEIASIARSLSLKADIDKEAMLLKISEYQESTTLSRESFIDKQRVVSSLLKAIFLRTKNVSECFLKTLMPCWNTLLLFLFVSNICRIQFWV